MIYIIMCTYNGEKYLAGQIESIINSNYKKWKLLIYDDISTDNTGPIIEKYVAENVGKIEYRVNEEKKGPKHNFIDAILDTKNRINKDDFIMLCDQDDVWFENKINDTLVAMEALIGLYGEEVPLLVSGDVTVTDDDLNVIAESFARSNHFITKHSDLSHHLMENHVQGCTMMINKTLIDLIHSVPKEISMHDDWIATIAYVFGYVGYIQKPLMYYRKTANSVTSEENGFLAAMRAKVGHLSEQKDYVYRSCRQARAFIDIYNSEMPERKKKLLVTFATLDDQSFFSRRFSIIRYKMWKSGIIRNIGLLLLV